jgi:hypothetical protein
MRCPSSHAELSRAGFVVMAKASIRMWGISSIFDGWFLKGAFGASLSALFSTVFWAVKKS